MTRYLLFKRDNYSDPENKTALVYFVNILETALTLRQYYTMFKEVVGSDFDPFEMACDFKNYNSPFWGKVNRHAALMGILLGFGERNAWAYHWKHFTTSAEYQHTAEAISFKLSNVSGRGNSSITNFSLPTFMVVDDGVDEMVEKYQKKRENKLRKPTKGKIF